MLAFRKLFERLGKPPIPAASTADGPLDLLDPAFVRHPYPTYHRLRREDPVHRLRSGAWLLTRHADVVEALGRPEFGNAPSANAVIAVRSRGRYVCADVAGNILPFLDKPEHILPRRLIGGSMRAHLAANPPQIETVARKLLDLHLHRGELDAMADYARPLSVQVISGILGLPLQDAPMLCEWSDKFFYLFAPIPSEAVRLTLDSALAAFRDYFAAIVRERSARPGTDLISRLLGAEHDGLTLSRAEVVDTCMLLFADGIENIDAAVANTLLGLQAFPDQRRLLELNPALAERAASEGLRYDAPAQMIARIAREDARLGSAVIRKGGVVFLALGAANRDPEVFANPDTFDLARDAGRILSFGQGRHGCLGATLVRWQVTAALRVLFESIRRINVRVADLSYRPRMGHRWLAGLPIRVTAA